MPTASGSWHLKGTYFESCNCATICPCRPQGDRPGGLSTYGECDFALSWSILEGNAGDLDLSRLGVVLTGRYWDENASAPPGPLGVWDVALFVDDRGGDAEVDALADIFLGRAGGDTLEDFAAAIGEVHAVRRASIELDHTPGRQRIDVPAAVTVRAREPIVTDTRVTCAIPGHDFPGTELVADVNRVVEHPLEWDLSGTTVFAAEFEYRGERA